MISIQKTDLNVGCSANGCFRRWWTAMRLVILVVVRGTAGSGCCLFAAGHRGDLKILGNFFNNFFKNYLEAAGHHKSSWLLCSKILFIIFYSL